MEEKRKVSHDPNSQTLDQAIKFHQAGNLQQAEQYYRHILQADPRNVDALHLLGVLYHQAGRDDLAASHIGEAVRLKPNFPLAYSNLGDILREQGKLAEAAAACQQAIRLKPTLAKAHSNLGLILPRAGQAGRGGRCLPGSNSPQAEFRGGPQYSGSCPAQSGQDRRSRGCP